MRRAFLEEGMEDGGMASPGRRIDTSVAIVAGDSDSIGDCIERGDVKW